jgi:ABC-type branched-subunit amino acid transport system substrate-binding protein
MKRARPLIFITALALALTACSGAPTTVAEPSAPPAIAPVSSETAASATPTPAAPAEPPLQKLATDTPPAAEAEELAPEPPRDLTVSEEEVQPPTIEVDPIALLARGRQALEQGEAALAEAQLTAALAHLAPDAPEKTEAAQLLATLYMEAGRYSETSAFLSQLEKPLPASLVRMLALSLEIEGNFRDAIAANLALIDLVDEMERDELAQRIGYLLDNLDESALLTLSGENLFTRIGGYAALRLARLRLGQMRPEEAEPLLWRLQFLFEDDPIGDSADKMVRRLVAARTQDPGHFGIMLPLTGKLAAFGERVLRGILLSTELLTKEQQQGLTLHIFDTRADPEVARRGVMELADRGVVGIIGPLKGNVAEAAALEAKSLGVPLVTPTPTAEVEGDGVFRLGLRPEDEIDRLARYAVQVAGIERFAILAPDTAQGRRYRKIFWDSVVRYGGEIAGSVLFATGDNISLKEPLAKLTGIHGLSKAETRELFEEERREELSKMTSLLLELGISYRGAVETMALDEEEEFAEYEPKPRVDFTGVFLPIGAKSAALLAPQLPYHDVFDATLLGLRSWNYSSLIEVGRKYVDGALFPVEWHTSTPEGQAFAASYKEVYHRAPGVLEVYGYDAGRLVLAASQSGSAQSRDEFRLSLTRLWAEAAVTGPLTTHPSGVIASEPKILTVKRGLLIPAPFPAKEEPTQQP